MDPVSPVVLPVDDPAVVESVVSDALVAGVERAVPLERLELRELVRSLDKALVELAADVVGAVGKSSESDVSKSTVAVPVELTTESVGTASTAGIG